MKVWLDDERVPLPEYNIWAKTAQEAIELLKTNKVDAISLDHDLGDEKIVGNGYDVVKFIEEQAYREGIKPCVISIHTSNVGALKKMLQGSQKAYDYWRETTAVTLPGPYRIDYEKERRGIN